MRSNRASVQRSVSEDYQNSVQSANSSGGEDLFSSYQLTEEDQEFAVELRRELKFYFMNPIEKFQARGRKPYKFGVQLFKILVVTIQLIIFGQYEYQFTQFIHDNVKAMEHLFLKDWDPMYDSFAYPSTRDLYAMYTVDGFYEHVDNVLYQYANIEDIAIGTYNFDVNMTTKQKIQELEFEIVLYEEVAHTDSTFKINLTETTDKFTIHVIPHQNISSRDVINQHCPDFSFDRLIQVRLNFTLESILLKTGDHPSATCMDLEIYIYYNYDRHGGRLPVTLKVTDILDRNCTAKIKGATKEMAGIFIFCYDVFVMLLCILSFLLCLRSLMNGRHLKKKTVIFFQLVYNKELSRSDRMEFLNLWYVIICISDCLTIAGTICKILLDFKVWAASDYCSLLLGCATSLVYFGILRYFGFFNKYNVLLLTLKKSMPNVLRFSVCAGIIYLAYGFCGWIVLGPYHGKFRTFVITMECMFSLINGDDMFATYEEMPQNKTLIFVFSKIYLYSFISLFIYVVLSLFISVIMDTYETVKDFQRFGHVEGGDLKKFIDLCEDGPESGFFRRKARKNWAKLRKSIRRYSSFEQTHHNPIIHGNHCNGPHNLPT